MKRFIKYLILCLALCLTLTACKKNRTKFVIGLDASFPPMGFYDESGNLTGYDIDLAREVAKRLNLEFEAKPIEWKNKDKEMSSKNIDCIWSGFTVTEEREKKYLFTSPYLSNEQVLVVNEDSKVKSLADAKDFVIECQSYSTAEDAINKNQKFYSSLKSVIFSDDYIKALDDLENRKVDGIVMDSIVARYMCTLSSSKLIIIDEPLADELYAVGFNKDKDGQELMALVQEALLSMQKDGTVSALSNKWFGKDISIIGR